MAKKKLILKESVTRRFMKLANVNANMVSNFLTEAEEEEEMMGDEPEMDAPEPEEMDMADEPAMDADLAPEEPEDADPVGGTAEVEDMVTDLLGAVAKWAESKGVKMEVEGDDAEDEGMEDMEMDMGDDVEPEGGEVPGEADLEMDMEAEDEEGEGNYGKMEEAEHPDDEEEDGMKKEAIVAEVTRRVARRLREMAKKSK
jgi:hypothetical protein